MSKHAPLRAALEDDDQLASSCRLPVDRASADILVNIDDCVLSPSSGMHLKKVSKPLAYPDVHSRRIYWFEGEQWSKARSLNRHVMELAGMRSFENLRKTDVILSSLETKDMEATLRSIVEATSWMDWWTLSLKSMAFKSSSDARLVCRLSLAGARCQLLVAKMASTLWANLVLKQHDAASSSSSSSSSPSACQGLSPVSHPSGWRLLLCLPPRLFLFLPWEGEEVLKVSCLPHSCRWEVYSGGIGVFGSP